MRPIIRQFFAAGVLVVSAHADTYTVDAYFIPPPKHAKLRVVIDCYDADNQSQSLGHITMDIRGSDLCSGSIITPDSKITKVLLKFSPPLDGFKLHPDQIIVQLEKEMHGKDVTWDPDPDQRSATYLKNIQAADQLLKNDPEKARTHAEYAAAIAVTGNQKIEATKRVAEANVANNEPERGLTAFEKLIETQNFQEADPKKKEVATKEWFDTIEAAAKANGEVDTKTGLITPAAGDDSKVTQSLEKLTTTLKAIRPSFEARADRAVQHQAASLGGEKPALENAVRQELSRQPYVPKASHGWR